jgi:formate C-acetyltransferase
VLLRVIHGPNFELVHRQFNSQEKIKSKIQLDLANWATYPYDFATFEEFRDAFYEEFESEINRIIQNQIRGQKARENTFAQPLVSIFMHDCIEKGLDLSWGGGRYNYTYTQLVGFSMVVDSLYAIRELVFNRKEFTIPQFSQILAKNWEGNEPLRQRILNKLPKWGNDQDEIDSLGLHLMEKYYSIVNNYEGIYQNGKFYPGYLTWVMHKEFGQSMGATPNGRLAGKALSNSLAPAAGHGKMGLTAICNSAAKIDHVRGIGSSVLNLTLLKSTLNSPDQRKKFVDVLETYFIKGGFQVQVNLIDPTLLKDAQKHPQKYQDLTVKVGGFSARFIDLSELLQNELIERNGFNV